MKRFVLSLLLGAAPAVAIPLAGCGGERPAAAPAAAASTRITGAEAKKLVAEGAFLLDVRTPAEFGDRHLDGATNIPVADLEAHLAEVPKDKPIVVYCASGGRSAAATEVLQGKGYNAKNLGPMSAWDP